MAEPYRERVGPQRSTDALRPASPEAFGAGLGRAIEQAGDVAHEIKKREKARRDEDERNALAVDVTAFDGAQRAAAIEAQDSAAPGGAGWTEARVQPWLDFEEQAAAGIGSERNREWFRALVTQRREVAREAGEEFEAHARGVQRRNTFERLDGLSVAAIAQPGLSPRDVLTAWETDRSLFVETTTGTSMPPEVRDARLREGLNLRAEALLGALPAQDAQAWLARGNLAADLTPEGRERAARDIGARQRLAEAEARRDATLAAAQDRAVRQAQAAEADVRVGNVEEGVIVDTRALRADLATAEAQAAGGDAEAIRRVDRIRDALPRNIVNETYARSSQSERREARRVIEATPGWQQNNEQINAHAALTALINRDDRQASNDQLGLYVSQSGRPLAPFSLDDPSGDDARFAQGIAAARRGHRPVQHLTEEETGPLIQQWDRGTPAARAEMVRLMALRHPQRAAELMRQITQDRPDGAILIQTATQRDRSAGAHFVREALNGWAAPASAAVAPTARMEAAVRRRFGAAMQGIEGQLRAGYMSMATGIYSARAAAQNLQGYNEEVWLGSFADALGRAGPAGGATRSARGGEEFLLPRGMAANDWWQVAGRAHARQVIAAAGGHVPQYAGHPLRVSELFALTPELVTDSNAVAHYRFRSGTGYVMRGDGRTPWVVDIRALARITRGQGPRQ